MSRLFVYTGSPARNANHSLPNCHPSSCILVHFRENPPQSTCELPQLLAHTPATALCQTHFYVFLLRPAWAT